MTDKDIQDSGVEDSSVMLKNYKDVFTNERLKKIQSDIAVVERMLKALIKSLENKHLNP